MSRFLAILLVACFLLGSLPAFSGEKSEPENAAQKAPSEKQQERVQVGVEMRWRFELRDNADQQLTDDFDGFLGQRIRAHLRFQLHPHLSVLVQGQEVRLFGAASDKVIHELPTNLHQAYFDWRPGGSQRWEFRAGRQELSYGDERLIGAFGWDNVGRSFDAARVRYRIGTWSNDFFAARVVDVRRAGARHRPSDQDFYGVYLTRAPRGSAGQTELYGLFLRDGLRTPGEFPVSAAQTVRIFTLGFRRNRQPKTGSRYLVEHGWQFGQRGPDPHRAAMFVSSGGYAWGGRLQPRLGVEYEECRRARARLRPYRKSRARPGSGGGPDLPHPAAKTPELAGWLLGFHPRCFCGSHARAAAPPLRVCPDLTQLLRKRQ